MSARHHGARGDCAPHPVGGRDYPRTLAEFNHWFPGEAACLAYLERLRWPAGFVCSTSAAGRAAGT